MTILFLRPADDSAAILAATCGQHYRQLASAFTTTDLSSSQVTRRRVDAEIPNHRNLIWFGHGEEDELVANGSAMVDSTNLANLQGGVVVAVACHAAAGLGQMAKPGGSVEAFLGFDDEVVFPPNGEPAMSVSLRSGLSGLVTSNDDVSRATTDLKQSFLDLRNDYKQQGQAGTLSASDARFAKMSAANHYLSVQQTGDGSAKL